MRNEWESCNESCPIFGKNFEDLAKMILTMSISDEDMLPNGCLYIKGYLTTNYDGIPSVTDDKECRYKCSSIISSIESYAAEHGFIREKSTGLGGTQTFIKNCNMRALFTKEETTLSEAYLLFDTLMYGGDLITDTSLIGYSEYTITGMDLDEFTIGGHNLEKEFNSHMGEYIHLIVECE